MGSLVYKSHVTDTTYLSHPNAIDIVGGFAYIGCFTGGNITRFSIWDLSNPLSPVKRGTLSNHATDYASNIYQLKKLGNYCYVSARNSDAMTIINVSDPDNPFHAGHTVDGQCVGVTVRAQYAYITSYSGWRFRIYDVSTPSSIVQKGQITSIFQPGRIAIDANGQYAFMIYNNNAMRIIDVSDVNNPSLMGTITISDVTNSLDAEIVKVEQNYVYIQGNTNLIIIDIANKSAPSIAAQISTGLNGPSGLDVESMFAYVCNVTNNQGLSKFNITGKTAPVFLYGITGSGNHMNQPQCVKKSGNYLYLGDSQTDELVVVEDIPDKIGPSFGLNATPGIEKNILTWNKLIGETFDNLDNWTIYTKGAGGTASIVSGKVRLTVPNADEHVWLKDNTVNVLPSGDFCVSIDIPDYHANDSNNSIGIQFRVYSPDETELFYIFHSERLSRHITYVVSKINGSSTNTGSITDLNTRPTKMMIARIGTKFYGWAYVGSWFLVGIYDHSSYASEITRLSVRVDDRNNYGGYVEFDNMFDIKTDHIYWDTNPGITKSDYKLEDKFTPFDHTGLIPNIAHYYRNSGEILSEEGDLSGSDISGTPLPPIPQAPANPICTNGYKKNTLTWDSVTYATSYNIYYRDTPGVTKLNGTKIAGVTSPHDHDSLTPGDPVYYVITAENVSGEGDESAEVYGTPTGDTPVKKIITGIGGDSENIISIDSEEGGVTYDLFFGLSSGVTIENGTKIEDVSFPHNHIDLIRQNYYYIIVGINEWGYGTPSDEICVKPAFDGKIWDHTEQIRRSLLYQYR